MVLKHILLLFTALLQQKESICTSGISSTHCSTYFQHEETECELKEENITIEQPFKLEFIGVWECDGNEKVSRHEIHPSHPLAMHFLTNNIISVFFKKERKDSSGYISKPISNGRNEKVEMRNNCVKFLGPSSKTSRLLKIAQKKFSKQEEECIDLEEFKAEYLKIDEKTAEKMEAESDSLTYALEKFQQSLERYMKCELNEFFGESKFSNDENVIQSVQDVLVEAGAPRCESEVKILNVIRRTTDAEVETVLHKDRDFGNFRERNFVIWFPLLEPVEDSPLAVDVSICKHKSLWSRHKFDEDISKADLKWFPFMQPGEMLVFENNLQIHGATKFSNAAKRDSLEIRAACGKEEERSQELKEKLKQAQNVLN